MTAGRNGEGVVPQRPLPQPDDATEPYWQACREEELRMQTCEGCGHRRFPPRPMCPRCLDMRSRWDRMSGRGQIYSWVICHPPLLPAFQERAPLLVVLVELEDDPSLRMVGNLLDCDPERVAIGMPVEVIFETVTDEVTLPQWKPVSAG